MHKDDINCTQIDIFANIFNLQNSFLLSICVIATIQFGFGHIFVLASKGDNLFNLTVFVISFNGPDAD